MDTKRPTSPLEIAAGLACILLLQVSTAECLADELKPQETEQVAPERIQRVHPDASSSPAWIDLRRRLDVSQMEYRLASVDWQGECYLVLADEVQSLEPLRGAELDFLDISGTRVTDLTPLTGMPLRELWLNDCAVKDLAPLRGMSLTALSLQGNAGISDLSPLRDSEIEYLNFSGTGVTDVRPLAGVHLVHVDARRTGVRDIAPLAQSELNSLQLDRTNVIDLSPLQATRLWMLSLSWKEGLDLKSLQTLPLTRLKLTGRGFDNLSTLSRLKLRSLELHDTNVIDLTPLRGMPLRELRLVKTPVIDLLPLADSNVVELYLSEPGIDLRQVAPLPLLWLRTPDPKRMRHFDELRSHTTLRWIEVSDFAPTYVVPFWRQFAPLDAGKESDLPLPLGKLKMRIGELSAENPRVRETAARRIATLRSLAKPATVELISRLNDSDADVVRAVGDALEAIGPGARNELLQGLSDKDPFIRHRCAYCLSNIRPIHKETVGGIIPLLTDPNDRVRTYAEISLGNLGPAASPAVGDLIERVRVEQKDVRRFAVEALGKIGPDAVEAVGPLIDALHAPDATFINAEVSLGEIGPAAFIAVPALLQRFREGFHRSNIARALGRIGPSARSATPDLLDALNSEDDLVRRYARQALRRINRGEE